MVVEIEETIHYFDLFRIRFPLSSLATPEIHLDKSSHRLAVSFDIWKGIQGTPVHSSMKGFER